MSLKINNYKRIITRSIWALLGIIFAVLFIRVAIWEDQYYNEKKGSPRITAEQTSVADEVDETVITDAEKSEYTVAADRPRYLSVAKLGISNARILALGLNSEGALDTPNNIFDVGWYWSSSKPGNGGTLLIDGHNGGPNIHGVFKDLPELIEGDIITIERGDGVIFNYSVVENKTVALSEADAYMRVAQMSPVSGKESVTLISCTGEWSQERNTYLSRQFVRAVLVAE